MSRKAMVIILFLLPLYSYPQQDARYIDSLKGIVNKLSVSDTTYPTYLLEISNAYLSVQQDSSLQYADRALKVCTQYGQNNYISSVYRQYGMIYYRKGDLVKAMDEFRRAIDEAEKFRDNPKYKILVPGFLSTVYSNMADIYADLKEYDKAIEYYKSMYNINVPVKRSDNQKVCVIALVNMGQLMLEEQKFTEAKEYLEKGLHIIQEYKFDDYLPPTYNSIGALYQAQKDYTNAEVYFKKGLQLAQNFKMGESVAEACNHLADIELANKNLPLALTYAKQGVALYTALGYKKELSDSYSILGKIYEEQHNTAAAYAALKNYVSLRDSVMNEDKKSEIISKQMEYEFGKKEAETKAGEERKELIRSAEIRKQVLIRNAIVALGLILIAAAFISFVFYKRRRDAEQKKKEAEFRTEVSETELKVLRLQMNPHFIFNSLNSISDYINKNEIKAADDYLVKFARVMRMILENSEEKSIPLAHELNMVELYMQLEARRLNNKFTYEIKVESTIDKEATLVPPLIIQPFIENSILHGLAGKRGLGKIEISITKENDMLHCVVIDNGTGRTPTENSNTTTDIKKKSMAMKITNARLAIINKMQNTRAGVKLSYLEEGVRADLILPLELTF